MKIYVVTHKLVKILENDLYKPILVGSYNKESENILRDDIGENISIKNENYCELTALFWIWKNVDDKIVGLCHYRRFFSKSYFSNKEKYFLQINDIQKDFEKNINLILPKKHIYNKTIQESLNVAPNKNDMKEVEKAILKLYPNYINAYKKYMNSYSSYLCNVMICNKEILDSYCEWLFKILFEVENSMSKDSYIHDNYRKRMFGFLSERLLNVWIIYNKEKLNIKEYYLINIESSLKEKIKIFLKQNLKKFIHFIRMNK